MFNILLGFIQTKIEKNPRGDIGFGLQGTATGAEQQRADGPEELAAIKADAKAAPQFRTRQHHTLSPIP